MTVDGTVNGGVTLTGGAVLAGTGELEDDVANTAGTVRPAGAGVVGILSVDAAYTQGAGATLEVDINAHTAGVGFDQLSVTGSAALAGTLAVVRLPGFIPAVGDPFQIVDAASRTGTFTTVTGTVIDAERFFSLEVLDDGARLIVSGPGLPISDSPPQVDGTVAVGSTVSCHGGTWQKATGFAYQWLRDGSAIPGAAAQTYTITEADAGHRLACREIASNASGSASAASAGRDVPAIPPQTTSAPALSGTVGIGGTLTCHPGGFSGAPAPVLTVAWLRDGAPIPGATQWTYTQTAADAGRAIACRVTGTNLGGSASATSGAEFPQVPPAPPPGPPPIATPTPKPKPKVKPKVKRKLPLQGASPSRVAAAFGLPSARRCVSRGAFVIRLRRPKGIRIRTARVLLDGTAVKVRKLRGRYTTRIDLTPLAKRRFTITIRIVTRDARRLRGVRRYTICAEATAEPPPAPAPEGGGGGAS
jgi:hypothetical protein